MRLPVLKICLSLICLALSYSDVTAQASIKVIVNDVPISTYDIKQRARLVTLSTRRGGAAARRMAEQELVDEVLQLGEAKRIGITVSDQDINGAFGNIARNMKMSTSQLSSALRRSGVNPQTLKDRLKAQIGWQKAVRARFQSQIKVDESQVIAALQKIDKEEKQTSIEYNLSQVIVVVPKKASSGLKAKRKRETNQIRKDFNGCDNAGAILGQYSEVVLKTVGRRLETELPEPMQKVLKETEVGRLAKPQKTNRGYEMIAVCGKRELASDIAARAEVENELRAKEGQQLARRYLRQLQQRATIIRR